MIILALQGNSPEGSDYYSINDYIRVNPGGVAFIVRSN